ncbi:MAG: copper chaperone CopZ [Marinoscillum sp.]|jgi:copper chaperone CopZ
METMNQKEYTITGMTCDGCVASVKKVLENTKGVVEAQVQLAYPQATIKTDTTLNLEEINQLLKAKGKYAISEEKKEADLAPFPSIGKPKTQAQPIVSSSLPEISINTYKPLIIIVSFIAGVSLLTQYPFNDFSGMLWMRHFMAGFFLVFSFFKLLNLEGFAGSYHMYDIVAVKWKTWGFIYPFVELGLGVAYLINFMPLYTNIATVIVLGVSSIGVIESNINKRKIKCACLGDVFNLPMSTVTIIEDLTMVGMAGWMLFVI